MLPLGITLFLLALVVGGFGVFGSIGTGGLAFALGFLVLASISLLSFWRAHAA